MVSVSARLGGKYAWIGRPKIKTMKRMAYGFRDMEFFKLKIMAIHESKYALVG